MTHKNEVRVWEISNRTVHEGPKIVDTIKVVAIDDVRPLWDALKSSNKRIQHLQTEYAHGNGVHLAAGSIEFNKWLIDSFAHLFEGEGE